MKKIILSIAMVYMCINLYAQKDSVSILNNVDYIRPHQDYFKRITFKIGGGVMLPQGNLKKYLRVSPLVELSLDFPVTSSKSLELAMQFVVPNSDETFGYVRGLDTLNTKASFIFNPNIKFKKQFDLSKDSQLFGSLGLGASIIKTNARNLSREDNEDHKYEMISTFLMALSLDYAVTLKSKDQFTISLGLNYAPYKIEGSLQQNIGGIALIPKLMYSF